MSVCTELRHLLLFTRINILLEQCQNMSVHKVCASLCLVTNTMSTSHTFIYCRIHLGSPAKSFMCKQGCCFFKEVACYTTFLFHFNESELK